MWSNATINVLLSDGDGTFRRSARLSGVTGELCNFPTGPSGSDVNGDGYLDVTASTFQIHGKIRYVRTDSGVFAVADFTLSSNAWLGQGDGTFGPHIISQPFEFQDWYVPDTDFSHGETSWDIDFDQDGLLDFAALTFDERLRSSGPIQVVLDYAGPAPVRLSFDIGPTHLSTIVSGDFDGDGWLDIAASGNKTLIVLLNDAEW